eukprot:scaffold78323_cov43-Phaeocystis_antarctica.AAC.4
MSVTLEVSKLSGWLNADAPCRESKEGYMVRGEVYGSGGTAGGGRPRRTQRAGEGATADSGQGTRGGAHPEHAVHGCDAGGVPVGYVRVEGALALEEPAHVSDP